MADLDDLYMEGLDLFADEEYRAAVEAFRKVTDVDPSYIDAWHGIARASFEARDVDPGLLDDAILAATKVVELDPDDVTAYSTLSQIYVFKGDKDTAEHWGGKARVAGWKQQLVRDKGKKAGVLAEDPDKQL
jgi:tetratricopeptide (TPR) repeat protein